MNLRVYVLFLTVISGVIGILSAQTTTAHKPAAKKVAAKKPPPKPTAATSAKKRTATKRVAVQPRQQVPTPDRYKEIQGALVARGYLKSEANGVWDAQSVDAMKRFQADQKQDATGKLTAASLIGLGLGPSTALISTAALNSPGIP
jgi:hypothetical protein